MKVLCEAGMVTFVDSPFDFGNIRNMYKGNQNGFGIQLEERHLHFEKELAELCNIVAECLYKIEDLTK